MNKAIVRLNNLLPKCSNTADTNATTKVYEYTKIYLIKLVILISLLVNNLIKLSA